MQDAICLLCAVLAVEQGESLRQHVPPAAVCEQACGAADKYIEELKCLRVSATYRQRQDMEAAIFEAQNLKAAWFAMWWVAWEQSQPAQREHWRQVLVGRIGEEAWVRQQWPPPLPYWRFNQGR